jgi:LysR family transcriptional regulator, nitrogen assimilation regulatory protein
VVHIEKESTPGKERGPVGMEFRQLRYFSAIARYRSFSKASERLHIAQPALSRQILALEQELGVKLLVRTVRGVDVTEAGARLQEMAEYVLRYVGEIRQTLTHAAEEPSGTVVVGLPPSLSYLMAPNLVMESRRLYPGLTIKIVEGFSVFLADWLEQGRLDFALLTDPGPIPAIETRLLAEEEMVLVGARELMIGVAQTLPFKDIVSFPLAMTNGFHRVIEPWLAACRISPSYEVEMDSIPVVKQMVLRGIYCSILPYAMVHAEVAAGDLQVARLIEPKICRRVVSAVNARRPVSMSIRKVEALVEQALCELPTPHSPALREASRASERL